VFIKTPNNNARIFPDYLGKQIKMNDFGGACGRYGREERCTPEFGGKN